MFIDLLIHLIVLYSMNTTNSVCPNFNNCPKFFKARIGW